MGCACGARTVRILNPSRGTSSGVVSSMQDRLLAFKQCPRLCALYVHTGKPMGVAVSHSIVYQMQLILTACQIRCHGPLWDHYRTGKL